MAMSRIHYMENPLHGVESTVARLAHMPALSTLNPLHGVESVVYHFGELVYDMDFGIHYMELKACDAQVPVWRHERWQESITWS